MKALIFLVVIISVIHQSQQQQQQQTATSHKPVFGGVGPGYYIDDDDVLIHYAKEFLAKIENAIHNVTVQLPVLQAHPTKELKTEIDKSIAQASKFCSEYTGYRRVYIADRWLDPNFITAAYKPQYEALFARYNDLDKKLKTLTAQVDAIKKNPRKWAAYQIGMGNYVGDLPVDTVLNAMFQFTNKVNKFYRNWTFETAPQLGQLCKRYTALTTLRLTWPANITFTELVTNLALLTQLAYLELSIDFDEKPENAFGLVERVDADEDGQHQPISLPQVKILELDLRNLSHHDFESLSSLIFPLVEVVILPDVDLEDCTICQPNINGQNGLEVTNRCHRLLILSLKEKFANPLVRLYAQQDEDEDEFGA